MKDLVQKTSIALRLFTFSVIASSMISSVNAQQGCDITYKISGGCNADGTTWVYVEDIAGGTSPYIIEWSTGDNSAYVDQLPEGTYTVTITGDEGCNTTMSYTTFCEDDGEEDCQFRTQTPGGWGAPPNGNNPGAYLHANFASCFPNGLTIGCDNTIELTSPQAITDLLPTGGQPGMIDAGNAVDPASIQNVMVGHLVALSLSVGFDACDPDFSSATMTLGDAYIGSGPLSGYTVQELLDEANSYIGGCGSSLNRGKINSALDLVNSNYVDGDQDNGKVDCEEKGGKKSLIQNEVNISTYPNPVSENLNVEIFSEVPGLAKLAIIDMTGRVVVPAYSISIKKDLVRRTNVDISSLPNGTYILSLTTADVVTSKMFLVVH